MFTKHKVHFQTRPFQFLEHSMTLQRHVMGDKYIKNTTIFEGFMKFINVFLHVLVCFFIFGCNRADSPTIDKVKIQLKYYHQAQFAGLYMAVERGYYKDENIEVEFVEGGGDVDLFTPIIDGTVQFSIASSDLILAKRVAGNPIKAIAVIYRKSACVFVSKVESNILRPHDLKNKKVAALFENAKEYEFQLKGMLKNIGVDLNEVEIVDLDRQYETFLSGEVDVTGAYVTGGALRLEEKGIALNYIWPSDYGIDFYSDTIFANDALIIDNPDLVLRFLRASLRGWNEAIRNSEDAVNVTLKYARIKNPALQTAMMKAQHPLIYTGDAQVGWMSKRIWSSMNTTLFEQGVIPIALDDIDTVYTTTFIEKIYNEQ